MPFRHGPGTVELLLGQLAAVFGVARRDVAQHSRAQPPKTLGLPRQAGGIRRGRRLVAGLQLSTKGASDGLTQVVADVVNAGRVGRVQPLGQQRFGRQQDRVGLKGWIERVGGECRPHRRNHRFGLDRPSRNAAEQLAQHQFLAGLVTRKGVRIRLGQPLHFAGPSLGFDDDGCGKAAVDRQQGGLRHPFERHLLLGLGQQDHLLRGDLLTAIAADQCGSQRDHGWLLVRLTRRGRHVLPQMKHGAGLPLLQPRLDPRRSRLAVPQTELGKVDPSGIFHRRHEILAGDRLSVVPLEIKVRSPAVCLWADDGSHHADDLRALVVHGRGVEVGDLDIAIRPDRVRQRPRVFRELRRSQRPHLADALHRFGAHRGRELLVAENGQPFLQAQLEPVAAGDAVARPVVEIFVRHHRRDRVEIGVAGRFRVGQDVA